ncbi:hypothetical protein EP7_004484 [Isosphaeraceae bacterium EP7]
MSFPEELLARLRRVPFGQAPAPWRQVTAHAVGGLTEVGFASRSDLLLVVSSQGRGLFEGRTGERIAHDPTPPDDGWYDEVRLTASGIGPLNDQLIRLAGLHGGGLSGCTDDGWGVTRIAPDWPLESIVLDPPGSAVMYEGHTKGCMRIAEDLGLRAFGFSETGLSLVVATSDRIELWSRHELPKLR